MMYVMSVTGFMFILPLLSIAVECVASGDVLSAALVAKWFAFWSVGWRLLVAGIKQIVQPEYTAKYILGLKTYDSVILVRELGFANVAIGLLGITSLLQPAWQLAAALTGGVFYSLAGINHLLHKQRNQLQNIAMVSDLFASIVLLSAYGIAVFLN